MDDIEQRRGDKEMTSLCSLQKQVQMLRRLLMAKETALAAKRAKRLARCLHSRQALASYGGPRDNGELDYQCMDCGAFL